uniref:Uncharacterized protein n=1 Tax=Trypanosoma vivax (strain Y486) TaxID=1055687 RepID=G0U4W4_TRYVY|nr:conserved hypothetical protein [Trypanosoma vivax Y486]
MKHFHALLNLALAYYQSGDYISAYKYAEHTHEKTLEMNKNATLLFFTATTCAYCARAVADAYETSLSEAQEASSISVSLAPPPSAVFSAQRAISKLREDAKRYDGIAQRMLKRPDKAFMRQKEAGRGWSEDAGRGDGEAQEPFGKEWKDRRKQPEYAAIRRDQMRRCGGNVPK